MQQTGTEQIDQKALNRAAKAIADSRHPVPVPLQRAAQMHSWRLHGQGDPSSNWVSAIKAVPKGIFDHLIAGSGSPAEWILAKTGLKKAEDRQERPFEEQALDWATASSGLFGMLKLPKHFTKEQRQAIRAKMIEEQKKRGPAGDDWFSKILRATSFHGSSKGKFLPAGSLFDDRTPQLVKPGEPGKVSTGLFPDFYVRSTNFAPEYKEPVLKRAAPIIERIQDDMYMLFSTLLDYDRLRKIKSPSPTEVKLFNKTKTDLQSVLDEMRPKSRTLAARVMAAYQTEGMDKAYDIVNHIRDKTSRALDLVRETKPVQRIMPLFGGPPEQKTLKGWIGRGTEKDVQTLQEAYVFAMMHFPENLKKIKYFASARMVTKPEQDEIFNRMAADWVQNLPNKHKEQFNKYMTSYLLNKGKSAILWHPDRYNEHELRMLRGEDVLGLDVRDFNRDPGIKSMMVMSGTRGDIPGKARQPSRAKIDAIYDWQEQSAKGHRRQILGQVKPSEVPILSKDELLQLHKDMQKFGPEFSVPSYTGQSKGPYDTPEPAKKTFKEPSPELSKNDWMEDIPDGSKFWTLSSNDPLMNQLSSAYKGIYDIAYGTGVYGSFLTPNETTKLVETVMKHTATPNPENIIVLHKKPSAKSVATISVLDNESGKLFGSYKEPKGGTTEALPEGFYTLDPNAGFAITGVAESFY